MLGDQLSQIDSFRRIIYLECEKSTNVFTFTCTLAYNTFFILTQFFESCTMLKWLLSECVLLWDKHGWKHMLKTYLTFCTGVFYVCVKYIWKYDLPSTKMQPFKHHFLFEFWSCDRHRGIKRTLTFRLTVDNNPCISGHSIFLNEWDDV